MKTPVKYPTLRERNAVADRAAEQAAKAGASPRNAAISGLAAELMMLRGCEK